MTIKEGIMIKKAAKCPEKAPYINMNIFFNNNSDTTVFL